MKRLTFTFALILTFVFSLAAQTNDEILQLLKDRVDVARSNVSVVVAVVDEKGTRFINYGKISKDANAPNADEHTLYEIGSITKTFVGTLFAEAIRRGEVKADDPISKYLPKTVKTPKRNGKEITLIDLVTHTSGLPRMPGNMDKYPVREIYNLYTVKDAFDFLSAYELPRDIGEKYEYSNFGMGLLAYILCERAKQPFEKLVTQRILKPLKMTETKFLTNDNPKQKLAVAFDLDSEPAPYRASGSPIFMGSGSIRSTTSDMAKYASANLGLSSTKLSSSFVEAQKPLRAANNTTKVGYAWHISDSPRLGRVIGHGGATFGYLSQLIFNPEKKRAVVVLTNTMQDINPIAYYVFDQRFPKPTVTPYFEVAEEVLDKYLGEYEFNKDVVMTVTRSGPKLFIQLTGQQSGRVYAKSQTEFYSKEVEASVIFNRDSAGKVISLTLRQNGLDQIAKKIK